MSDRDDLTPDGVLSLRPKMIIGGRIGVGKSTEVAKALGAWRWYVSNPTNLGPYAQWFNVKAREGYSWPKTTLVLENDTENFASWYKGMITKWTLGAVNGRHDQPGLVLDEFSTMLEWMLRSISGKKSGMYFDEIAEMKEITSWTIEQFCKTDRGLCLVMHTRRERRFGEIETEANHPRSGDVKYDAGPAFPIGTIPPLVVRELDVVWELIAEADPDEPGEGIGERYFLTQPGPYALRKTRRFKAPPKVTISKTEGLRSELLRLGYRLT